MFNITSQPLDKLITTVISLIGVTLVTSNPTSVQARPVVIIEAPLPTTQVIGSPIPSPVPLIPGTTIPYTPSALSDYYGSYNRDYNTVILPPRSTINNSPYNNYNYRDYNTVIVPRGNVINNSPYNNYNYTNYRDYNTVIVPSANIIDSYSLINSRIVNPRINNSVLINPVIINSPRYPVAPISGSRFIYTSPGIRINLGQ